MRIALGGIDHGGLSSKAVADYCRTRFNRWVAMKGSGNKDLPIIEIGRSMEVNRKNKRVAKGAKIYQVGYSASVNHLKGQLRVEQPGPRYLHLGTASTDDFLRELFPWKRVPKTKERREYKWDLPAGSRDEGGDCTRMAYAALLLLARRYNRATMWDQLEAQLGNAQAPQSQKPLKRRTSSYWAGG